MEHNLPSTNFPVAMSNNRRLAVTASDLRFDWLVGIVSVWWLGGLFIDGWAHSNIPQLETFFTPWHAVFYSGYLAVATVLIVKTVSNLRHTAEPGSPLLSLISKSLRNGSFWRAAPSGYELSLLGLLVFLVSGIGDMTWHIIFGIEKGTEALLSPTHLGLALGIGLSLSGPMRAAWRRPDRPETNNWRTLGPAIFSLLFTFSLITFFTVYASPFAALFPLFANTGATIDRGIIGIMLITLITMSFVLLAVRRWRLPMGAFTLMFGVNILLMWVFSVSLTTYVFPAVILAGVGADVLNKLLRPSDENLSGFRLFAFCVPFVLFLLYFIDLALTGPIIPRVQSGITWSTPFWTGSIFIAGAFGLLLSYVMMPPAKPTFLPEEVAADKPAVKSAEKSEEPVRL